MEEIKSLQNSKSAGKKILPKASKVWFLFVALYCLFIFALSFLYPLTSDEYFCPVLNISCYINSYLYITPRIGGLVGVFVLMAGRWSFLLLNPFVQLSLVFLLFYLIYLRLPNFKKYSDFPPFLLLAILSVFGVITPDLTIFWISGAVNYSWLAVPFLLFLCLLRKSWHNFAFVPSKKTYLIIAFFGGIFLGMTNENSAPMALCLGWLFVVLSYWKRKKIPYWFYPVFTGIIVGLILLFSAPAHNFKLHQASFIISNIASMDLFTRFYFHLYRIADFMEFNLMIWPLTFLTFILVGYDKFKTAFKDEDFLLCGIALFVSMVLALVLFIPPNVDIRTFYSASLFSILALLFILKYASKVYKINFVKYVFYFAVFGLIFIGPRFVLPYFYLYKQDVRRMEWMEKEISKGKDTISLPSHAVMRGPTPNLTITFYDPMLFPSAISQRLNLNFKGDADKSILNDTVSKVY